MTKVPQHDLYYQAMLSRDSRFDGLFFAGVTSTGIYCRSICPAPKPKKENVIFFSSSSGAEKSGFRPCKRCRPDASPGTPLWTGNSTYLVSRALQMIGNGFLDEHNVEKLAKKLDIGSRQLRRIFIQYLGAPPKAIAQTRRLDFARKLIDETTISMTEVAYASGFESIRRFNDAIKKRFGESPTQLREIAQGPLNKNQSFVPIDDRCRRNLHLKLPFRPPMDWNELLLYLKGRMIAGVENIDQNSYSRSICMKETKGQFRRCQHKGAFTVSYPGNGNVLELDLQISPSVNLMHIVHRIRSMFDLDADSMFITDHLGKDTLLSPILKAFPGLRVPGGWDAFEIGVRAIVGQQVSIKGANTVIARIVERCGTPLGGKDLAIPGIQYLFPEPRALAYADLSGVGMPTQRIAAIQRFAKAVAYDEIQLTGHREPEEIKTQLKKLPGIGEWTAQYIAMRALRQPDAFPGTDLALKRELEEMAALSENNDNLKARRPDIWRPWRAYAAVYLWKNYSNKDRSEREELNDE